MSWYHPIIFSLGLIVGWLISIWPHRLPSDRKCDKWMIKRCIKELDKVIREKAQLYKLYLDTRRELDRVMWNIAQENKRRWEGEE